MCSCFNSNKANVCTQCSSLHQLSCSFNFLIILTILLITLRHVCECVCVRFCARARTRRCHPWAQRPSRSLINSRRASQGLPKCQGGRREFAALCAPVCSYTRELIAAHHSHWSQMVGKSVGIAGEGEEGCVCECWREPSKSAGVGQVNHKNQAHSLNIMPG